MERELTCKDCAQKFVWNTIRLSNSLGRGVKTLCPECTLIHNHARAKRYRLTENGIQARLRSQQRRKERYQSAKIVKAKRYCIDCGELVHRRSMRCIKCFRIYLRTHNIGVNHPNWKGGIQRTGEGYIYVRCPNHPSADRGGRVSQHRLVWEQVNRMSLPKGYIIHHLNGVKYDNRIKNLVALPNRKHYLVLAAKARRIQELEALLNGQHQLL